MICLFNRRNGFIYFVEQIEIEHLPAAATCLKAKREHPEKWYKERWCWEQGGQIEVVLPDKTRCDCVTDTHAIEFDFGSNWAEAVGQSFYYSSQTGKIPGIVRALI